jgi:plastocyanin
MSGSRTRSMVASAAAVLLVTALSGVAGGSPSARGGTVTVRALGDSYTSPHWSPKITRIDSGTRVKWVAVTNDHRLVAYGGGWTFNKPLPEGSSVTRRFAHAGKYTFRCRVHSSMANGRCQGMCGKVVVD